MVPDGIDRRPPKSLCVYHVRLYRDEIISVACAGAVPHYGKQIINSPKTFFSLSSVPAETPVRMSLLEKEKKKKKEHGITAERTGR